MVAAAIRCLACICEIVDRGLRHQLLQRNDVDLVDASGRSLGRRVVSPERLDCVADELEADGLSRAWREYVDDPAPHREFARFVGRILAACSRLRPDRSPRSTGDTSSPDLTVSPAFLSRAGWRQSRQQRRRRCDNKPGATGAQRVQGTGPGRRYVEMRGQPAVGIDFVRGKRQHCAGGLDVRDAFKRGEKEACIRSELFDLGVTGGDEHRRLTDRRGRGKQRLRRRSKTAHPPPWRTKVESAGSRLEQRAQCQRRGRGRGHGDRAGDSPEHMI